MKKIKITRRMLMIAPVALIVLIVAAGWWATWYWSFDTRFARSRAALDAYATVAMASDPTHPLPALPAHLGAFETFRAERLPHGFLFFCDYGNMFDANGLAYSTEPPVDSAGLSGDFFQHVSGNWYSVFRN